MMKRAESEGKKHLKPEWEEEEDIGSEHAYILYNGRGGRGPVEVLIRGFQIQLSALVVGDDC